MGKKGFKILFFVLAGAALVGLAFYFFTRKGNGANPTTLNNASGAVGTATGRTGGKTNETATGRTGGKVK